MLVRDQQIIEKREQNLPKFVDFIVTNPIAFDRVMLLKLWGIPNRLIQLIKGIYRRNTIILQDVVANTRKIDNYTVGRFFLFNIFIDHIINTC